MPAVLNTATSLNLSRLRDGVRSRSPVELTKDHAGADSGRVVIIG